MQAAIHLYQPYVTETAITFEADVPTVQEFEAASQRKRWPNFYLAAEVDGKVVGIPMLDLLCTCCLWFNPLNCPSCSKKKRVDKGSDHLYWALEEKLQARVTLRFLACIAVPERSEHCHAWKRLVSKSHISQRLAYKFNKCWYNLDAKTIDGR